MMIDAILIYLIHLYIKCKREKIGFLRSYKIFSDINRSISIVFRMSKAQHLLQKLKTNEQNFYSPPITTKPALAPVQIYVSSQCLYAAEEITESLMLKRISS